MSIWGALTNSTAAMMAQSVGMGAISQNIANVNTTAYKRVDTQFKTMLSETTPQFDFFGVRGTQRSLIDRQGLMLATGNWSDLAINGRGFFMVSTELSGGQTLFTRDGGLRQLAVPEGTGYANYLTDTGGNYLLGWEVGANGAPSTTLEPVNFSYGDVLPGAATTAASVRGNIDANATEAGFSMAVYDDTFTTRGLDADWTKTSANTWDVVFTLDGGAPSAPVTVTFDGSARMTSPTAPISLAVTWPSGGTGTIEIDLAEMTQYGGATVADEIQQDGYAEGYLSSLGIDQNGVLQGQYSNGVARDLWKIPVANFAAPNNLDVRGGNLFAQTAEAGEMTIQGIDEVGMSAFVAGSLEMSNADMADEFTKMIITQKAYTSAATVFRTADEMTISARDLKR